LKELFSTYFHPLKKISEEWVVNTLNLEAKTNKQTKETLSITDLECSAAEPLMLSRERKCSHGE